MESRKKTFYSLITSVALSVSSIMVDAAQSKAPTHFQVSRYTSMDVSDVDARRNIMVSVIDETFGDDIATVGDAVDHLAKKYGYRIGHSKLVDDSQYYLFNLPLPNNQREVSPFPLISTFALLGGEGFDVVVHPARREISYQLESQYQDSFSKAEIAQAKQRWLKQHPVANLQDSSINENCDRKPVTTYGLVKDGDTLIAIKRSLQMEDISDAQAMMTIFDLNPSAFLHRNINYLIKGVSLNIPSIDVMRSMPKTFAQQRMNEHNAEWHWMKTNGLRK